MTERKPETSKERRELLEGEVFDSEFFSAWAERRERYASWTDEEVLAGLHRMIAAATESGGAAPWMDKGESPRARIAYAYIQALLLGRPQLATDLILRDPDLVAGGKSREGGRSGGRKAKERRRVPDEELEEAMLEIKRTRGRNLSWSAAAEKVGEKVGYTGKWVRERIPWTKEDW